MAARTEQFLHQLHRRSRPLVMAIVNATPDSFFTPSRVDSRSDNLEARVAALEAEGADLIDVGAESSRPGSSPIDEAEEIARLVPLVERLRACTQLPLSVDTRRAGVAALALDAGADIINDIYALRQDPAMLELAVQRRCPLVLMHMQGDPATMQVAPHYGDVVGEVAAFLSERARVVVAAGLPADYIVVDPGLGFGKSFEHNLALLRSLPALAALGYPVLVGHSRKGFIGTMLADANGTPRPVEARLHGSVAVAQEAARLGARIVRAHDVGPTVDALKVQAACAGGND